jgi:hypothetical protein
MREKVVTKIVTKCLYKYHFSCFLDDNDVPKGRIIGVTCSLLDSMSFCLGLPFLPGFDQKAYLNFLNIWFV